MWDPQQYHRFQNERSRPFYDLLAQIDLESPRTIVDLGCGSGELTAQLSGRWSEADVVGIDSSPEMINEAKTYERPGKLEFRLGGISEWEPEEPVDLLFSNAAYQWVPDHERLIPRLAGFIASEGTMAFQVPGNFDAPSHTILAELRQSEKWKDKLAAGADRSAAVQAPEWYIRVLQERGFYVTAWETTYYQIMPGNDPVLEWVKGTALRPVLAILEGKEREEFLDEYRERLRMTYPPQSFGTIFPFRRIFVIARKA